MISQTPVKQIAAIHDLSGFGRTSLSVVIPILSTMGLKVCLLPTAVLSSHSSSRYRNCGNARRGSRKVRGIIIASCYF